MRKNTNRKKAANGFGSKLKSYFLKGVLTIVPVGATIWIFSLIVKFGDSILGSLIETIFGVRFPLLSVFITMLIVLAIGYLANKFIGRKIGNFIKRIFENIPIIREVYRPVRDIINQFSSKNTNKFKRVVYVEFPKNNCYSIGFITSDDIEIMGEKKAAVFIPTTPNPTNGFLIYLTKEHYREIDITVDVALKSIISLGVMTPEMIRKINTPSENVEF